MDGPGIRQVPEGSGEKKKVEEAVCEIICDVQTTFAVKGQMMMTMISVQLRCHLYTDVEKSNPISKGMQLGKKHKCVYM